MHATRLAIMLIPKPAITLSHFGALRY